MSGERPTDSGFGVPASAGQPIGIFCEIGSPTSTRWRKADRLKPGLQTRNHNRLLILQLIAVILSACALCTSGRAQQEPAQKKAYRFCAVDIYVDSGNTTFAAYQLEVTVTNGAAKIAGIEGGEHPAFHNPPYYDPKAMQNERVILAAFSLAPAQQLPTGRTRVATIHFMMSGNVEPQLELKLQAIADAQGNKIAAAQSNFERKESK